jgi:hypothetical protein
VEPPSSPNYGKMQYLGPAQLTVEDTIPSLRIEKSF